MKSSVASRLTFKGRSLAAAVRLRGSSGAERGLRLCFACCVAIAPLFAAIDGTVVNGTSSKPQANVVISLVEPSAAGMKNLETIKTAADGKFHFFKEAAAGGPQIVQALFAGVTYTKVIPPGAASSAVQVDVYDSSSKPGIAKVSQDLILYQPGEQQVSVNQSIFFQNASTTTYNNPRNGALRFYLPPQANGNVKVAVTAPGGMPIVRAAEKTAQKNVYSVNYPIKPGETRFDLTYALPVSKPMIVSGEILHREGPTRIAVPAGVALQSDDVTLLGQEPQTKASIYDVKGPEFKAELEWTAAAAAPDANADEDSGEPQIREIQPHVYGGTVLGIPGLYWIAAITLSILALGLFLLYRSDRPAPAEAAEGDAQRKPVRKGAASR